MWGLVIKRSFALFVVLVLTMVPFLSRIGAVTSADLSVSFAQVSREFLFAAMAYGTAAAFDGSEAFKTSNWRDSVLGVVEVLWLLTGVGIVLSASMLFLSESVLVPGPDLAVSIYIVGVLLMANSTALAMAVAIRRYWTGRG